MYKIADMADFQQMLFFKTKSQIAYVLYIIILFPMFICPVLQTHCQFHEGRKHAYYTSLLSRGSSMSLVNFCKKDILH